MPTRREVLAEKGGRPLPPIQAERAGRTAHVLIDTTVGWNPCWVSPAATATSTTIRTGDVVTEPATVELELVPIRGRPGCFAAVLPDGRVLIRASRQPLLDGARALAAEGVPRETVITARHRGSTIVAMRSTLAEAAKWTIEESDRGGLRKRLWRPFGMAGSSRDGVPENARGHVDVEDRPPAAAALLDGHMARSGEPFVSMQVSRMVRA